MRTFPEMLLREGVVSADELAAASHERAAAATKDGKLAEEIVPVPIPQRKGEPVLVTTDERPRRDTTVESLAKLKPAFREAGTVTAGNSSGINDGAAAVMVMTAAKAKSLGLVPLARIASFATSGLDPATMGMGPVPAVKKALEKANLSIADIDYWELNEAFASQALGCFQELGIDPVSWTYSVRGIRCPR